MLLDLSSGISMIICKKKFKPFEDGRENFNVWIIHCFSEIIFKSIEGLNRMIIMKFLQVSLIKTMLTIFLFCISFILI